jgi:general nucleoside transport system permease protein
VSRFDLRRILPSVIAPVAAILLAAGISSLILLSSGEDPFNAFSAMFKFAFADPTGPDSMTDILNRATSYYLAAIAVAIGFRMALFNIGVDGQYRLATLLAGALGAASFLSWLPGPLRILLVIVVAMAVGAAWAGIAALLKVYRGVSEVISTIMLNFAAGSLFAYLLTTDRLAVQPPGSQNVSTPLLPASVRMPGFPPIPGTSAPVFGFIVIAAVVGVGYWFLLGRTRFGYDLRATGHSPAAAVASGVNAKRMVISTMLISGGVAGLVGLPELLGREYAVTTSVGGLGFTGIAIALLGRNHPIGIVFAALLWAFLDRTKIILDLEDIPQETIVIMQGVTVLAVVVAYELAARVSRRQQQRSVGAATGEAEVVTPEVPAALAALPGVSLDTAIVDDAQREHRQEGDA